MTAVAPRLAVSVAKRVTAAPRARRRSSRRAGRGSRGRAILSLSSVLPTNSRSAVSAASACEGSHGFSLSHCRPTAQRGQRRERMRGKSPDYYPVTERLRRETERSERSHPAIEGRMRAKPAGGSERAAASVAIELSERRLLWSLNSSAGAAGESSSPGHGAPRRAGRGMRPAGEREGAKPPRMGGIGRRAHRKQ